MEDSPITTGYGDFLTPVDKSKITGSTFLVNYTRTDNDELKANIGTKYINGANLGLATNAKSDVVLYPRKLCKCPFRIDDNNVLVMCDAYDAGGMPLASNRRAGLSLQFETQDNGLEGNGSRIALISGFHLGVTCPTTVMEKQRYKIRESVIESLGKSTIRIDEVTAWYEKADKMHFQIRLKPSGDIDAADTVLLALHIVRTVLSKSDGVGKSLVSITGASVSTKQTRGTNGATIMLDNLNQKSGGNCGANRNDVRFNVPAEVARVGRGYYNDSQPIDCPYTYLKETIALWQTS